MSRKARKTVLFISTMDGSPWGGSEELWTQTAKKLAQRGVSVIASVCSWSPPHSRITDLAKSSVVVRPRAQPALWKKMWLKAIDPSKAPWIFDIATLISVEQPELIVLSDGGTYPDIELIAVIAQKNKFVTISNCNSEAWWPRDELGARFRESFAKALKCFFVSEANRRLAKKQIGYDFANAEVIRNPYQVKFDVSLPWPAQDGGLRLACVGRLEPWQKGQDLLVEALARPEWSARSWQLTFYGTGSGRRSIEYMVESFGLKDRVSFAGHCSNIEQIWDRNHVLVQPSRYEGLPLTIVEAMLCARPIVATDVAGHSEVIKDGATGFLAGAPTTRYIADALERAWQARAELERMGKDASELIHNLVPPDPAGVFADKLIAYL
jgi:glycosyltransferase involved in cell wall biosynthesis